MEVERSIMSRVPNYAVHSVHIKATCVLQLAHIKATCVLQLALTFVQTTYLKILLSIEFGSRMKIMIHCAVHSLRAWRIMFIEDL